MSLFRTRCRCGSWYTTRRMPAGTGRLRHSAGVWWFSFSSRSFVLVTGRGRSTPSGLVKLLLRAQTTIPSRESTVLAYNNLTSAFAERSLATVRHQRFTMLVDNSLVSTSETLLFSSLCQSCRRGHAEFKDPCGVMVPTPADCQ